MPEPRPAPPKRPNRAPPQVGQSRGRPLPQQLGRCLIAKADGVVGAAILGIDLGGVRQEEARDAGLEWWDEVLVADRDDRLGGGLAEEPAVAHPGAVEGGIDAP